MNKQRLYKQKSYFHKENYLSKEDASKLKEWLIVGYLGNYIDSSHPFSRNKEIQSLLKKHPMGFKKIINDNIKCVDKKIILFSMACLTFSGKEGKHVLNDIFLKYIKTMDDLYFFISYVKEMRNFNEMIVSLIAKFIRNQSFEKTHKEILMYRDHETGINFSFIINKCGLLPRNEKEELYFKYFKNQNTKCRIPIIEDFNLLKKNKQPKNIEKFNLEMLPNLNGLCDKVVKNTSINTIFYNMNILKEYSSLNYIEKISIRNYNKYLAARAYNDFDSAAKYIVLEHFKESKKLKKKICNIIDHDLVGLSNEIQTRNIPLIFSQQFENCENIIFETHERFRKIDIDIEDVLKDNETIPVKLRDNTVIYFDNFIGHLMEQQKKVDTFIVWTYGKEFTLKKRPEIIDIYNTYCGRDIKIVFVYFNEQKDFSVSNKNTLKINGFNIYRTEEIIKRFIYGDI